MPATPAMDSGGGPSSSAPNISILGKVQQVLNQQLANISGQIQQQPYVSPQQRTQLQVATNQLNASTARITQQRTPAQIAQEESFIIPRRSVNQYQDPFF